ncbi:MAG: hypothetical protein HRT71_13810 [Flavobacteriales bacterium]|nr:hypothetical protein [Flavobacteriales bacterium]
MDQLVFATTYFNLTINNAGFTATLDNDIIVTSDLKITSGTLETHATNNYSITLGDDWSNSGTFNQNLGTVTLNGTGTQDISGGTFYNLYLNNPSGTTSLGGDVTVTNTFTMSGGDVASNSNTLEMGTSTSNQDTFIRTSEKISGAFKR